MDWIPYAFSTVVRTAHASRRSPHTVCGYNTAPPLWWKVIDKFDLRSGSSFQTYGLGIKVSQYWPVLRG
jgi:hypothetical protein